MQSDGLADGRRDMPRQPLGAGDFVPVVGPALQLVARQLVEKRADVVHQHVCDQRYRAAPALGRSRRLASMARIATDLVVHLPAPTSYKLTDRLETPSPLAATPLP